MSEFEEKVATLCVKVDKIGDDVQAVVQALKGYNGYKGLCDDMVETHERVGKLELKFWVLVGLLTGSGVIGGVGISQLLGG